jgi:hypothetical protein
MLAIVASIHVFAGLKKVVDARVKPAHDDVSHTGPSQPLAFLATASTVAHS